jgi:TolB-like protein/Flp pilus assembly protein TadD
VVSGRIERRLAAILAADMVGYSRLMEADETGTIARQRSHRSELIDPKISAFKGRMVKTTGDGMLVEFASAVDAVECAVDIQQAMNVREADRPVDQRIRYRIGINVGDIVIDGDDIVGDGVNVAARMEGLAEPGGIAISGNAHEQIQGKLVVAFEDGGPHEVKNIARPIDVWLWQPASNSATAANPDSSEPPPLPDKPAIAVLPFANMSGDPEQEYFADGMAEDIITSLSKLSQLLVIARNSSFTYKGRAVKVPEIGKELGVRYVIEGSVRKAGNRVRITAQLIDCSTGGHLWAERFDRELTDIFAVQDEVTQEIVSAMALKLTADERQRLKTKGPSNLEAYDYVLRGREQYRLESKEGNVQAEALLEQAIDLDPGYAPAYAYLAYTHMVNYLNRWNETADQPLEHAIELAQKAVALDETNPWAHHALGTVYLWKRQHDQAIAELEKAIALEPNFAAGYVLLGLTHHYAGNSKKAIELIDPGMRLDPHYPDIRLHWLAQAYFQLGRYEEAIDLLKRRLIRKPDTDISRVLLAASYGHLGQVDKAEWAEVFRINPDYSLEHRRQVLPYKDPTGFNRVVEGLRKAGLTE